MLIKDAKTGQVAEEYQKFIESKSYTPLDVSHFFNECFAKKDEDELDNIKKSALVTTYFLSTFIKKIEKVIDEGSDTKHSELTQTMQDSLSSEAELKKCALKIGGTHQGVSIYKEFIDIGPAINVQSGGSYSSSLFPESTNETLKSDCIVLGLGTLYKSFNSYVSRTLLINPTEEQKSTYKKVIALTKIIQQNLKPDVALHQIY